MKKISIYNNTTVYLSLRDGFTLCLYGLDSDRSFLLQNLEDPAFRIYYDELENLMAVLLDIHKEKYGK